MTPMEVLGESCCSAVRATVSAKPKHWVAREANNKGFLKHKEALLLCDGISEYRTFQ